MIPLGILAVAGASSAAAGAYELISSTILTSAAATVSLSSIPSTYKHLQIRMVVRSDRSAANLDAVRMNFNSDTGANYAFHTLSGDGGAVSSSAVTAATFARSISAPASSITANVFGSTVIDILDYANTSKNKTTRALVNASYSNLVHLYSNLWLNTSAISTISFDTITSNNFSIGSRFSLYGIKG